MEELKEFVSVYKPGEVIFREGERGSFMYVIQSGQVEITKSEPGGEKLLAVLEEGDFFGEMAMLEDEPRTASARARTLCKLLKIDRNTFDQLIRHNPEISIRMLRKLCRRLREKDEQAVPAGVESSASVEAPVRHAAYLLHEPTGIRFPLPNKEEITIGRYDPVTGISPDIDLKSIDSQRTTSRRHARIFKRESGFTITEEVGCPNGTFVNNRRVRPGMEVPVNDGDELRFGLVSLRFHLA